MKPPSSRLSRALSLAAKALKRRRIGRTAATRLHSEELERRLALAVSVFTQPTFTESSTSLGGGGMGGIGLGGSTTTTTVYPGWVTIVTDNADDLYLQQVATAPQSLLWANNSSFFNQASISNPESGEPYQAGAVSDIDSFKTIYVTNGQARSDSGVLPDNAPMYSVSDLTTRFRLNDGNVWAFEDDDSAAEIFGEVRYTQADGVVSTWTFTNWQGAGGGFNGNFFRITSGPGYGDSKTSFAGPYEPFQPVPSGYVIPTSMQLRNNSVGNGAPRASLEFTWNDRPTSMPQCDATYFTFNGREIRSSRGVMPSANPVSSFTLPQANGGGSLGIVPGTLTGSVGDVTFQVSGLGGGLRFSAVNYAGSFDAASGVVTVEYLGRLWFSLNGPAFDVEDPGALSLSASYAVYTQDQRPNSVTFFAGQNISREISVDLLTPGSTINVDSPIRMGTLPFVTSSTSGGLFGVPSATVTDFLASGDIDLKATNVNVNAVVESRDRLNIGNPLGDGTPMESVVSAVTRQPAVRAVEPIADIAGGKVWALRVPPGFTGVGYDRDNPPIVTISDPVDPAFAKVTGINGRVTELVIRSGGSGYTTAPTVTIAPPDLPGGRQATATAIVQAGVVQRLAITDAGSGYSQTPTISFSGPGTGAAASTRIRGSVRTVEVVQGGSNYNPLSPPAVTFVGGDGTAAATAILVAGRVTAVTVTAGGNDYSLDASTAVFIAGPPPNPFADRALAQAVFDSSGTRIVGFEVTRQGSGYGVRPTVAISAPVAASAARVLNPTPVDGSIQNIEVIAPGYGYTVPPLVWISAPSVGVGGQQATAEADIDSEGRITRIRVTDPGSGYDPSLSPIVAYIAAPIPSAETETVSINAAVSASIYDVRLANDLDTPDAERGTLLVSQSGSLGKTLGAMTVADSIFVQAQQADVVIEGTVWVKEQSYLLQSISNASALAPYLLTTTSPRTGASVGTIRGGTVGITLANDSPTPADGAVVFNDVDLHTEIDSLRIRAATSSGATRSEPFPYELRISEDSSIAIEAVAASSFPITVSGKQNILFNAAFDTASDVNIDAGSLFTLSAPVSTTRGRIDISAQNLTLESSLRVTQAQEDPTRDDIVLEATGGSVGINGLVSAVNNVNVRQLNRKGPNTFDYSNREPVAITDNTTVSRSITVVDAFTFENLDVGVDITHTFVGDLSAVLIAPDGTRVRLFSRVGGGGDNFTGTIFDSEATTPIAAGTAPFTGRFVPQESLSQLYGRDARGTWRLEVTDSGFGDAGSLTNFSLFFSSPQPATGRVAGMARIRADHLAIDAEGIVGNPDAAPGTSSFYLRTNVDSLSGRAGESFAIDELNDINVLDLRAGGLVSLRANGVDPSSGANAGRPALKASLADVSSIDVNAPSGSIEVVNNAPRTIVLGNAEALRRGTGVSMIAAGNVTIRSSGGATRGEIFALDAPLAGSGARTVRYLANYPSGASYAPRNPGTTASTISGIGSLAAATGLGDLRVSDRLLVTGGGEASGVYSVTNLGGPGTARWMLTRAGDSDTAAELPSNSFVRVAEGSGSGVYQLTYAANVTTPFARCPINVTAATPSTNIGSDDPNDAVTFVVSTAGGTNTAAGSLGKMMLLRQQNDTAAEVSNPNQKMDFRFSGQVVLPIQLTQQLPVITKAITINGNTSYNPPGSPGVSRPRITVDGSRITQSRFGNPVPPGMVINGFDVRGAAAVGTVLSNMTVAGFTKGAAVQVQDANTILLNALTLGSSEIGLRVPNEFGLRVSGTSSEVTLLNSTVTASTKAGVRVEGSASNVGLVGNTIGLAERDNAIGVQFDSTGTNRLGLLPVGPLVSIPTVAATRVTATTFTLPASFRGAAASLVPGLGVTGTGIAASGTSAAVVQSVAVNATTGITSVVITGGTVASSGTVTFANYAVTTLGGRQIELPGSISPESLYLGQSIAGTGIVPGTRISAIGRGPTTTVTLSTPMTGTGLTAISFPGPNNGAPRNVIQSNLVGVELRSGSGAVINTSITNNALDGLRIFGGNHVVGQPDRRRSGFSNVIFGNGGFGVVFDAGANGRTTAVSLASQQVVRGNFLGVTSGNQAARLNTKGNIGVRYSTSTEELYAGEGPDFKFRPLATTFVDAEGNQHNATTTGGGGTGSPPRRGVPPVPPRRR